MYLPSNTPIPYLLSPLIYWYISGMPRVSKAKLAEEELKEIHHHFSSLIVSLANSKASEEFFDEFLTAEEKLMLSKRLLLLLLLKKEYSPSKVQQTAKVSYETVRIYQIQLKSKSNNFHKTLESLTKKQEVKNFLSNLNKALKPLELALDSKTNMRSRAKLLSGDYH